VVPAPCEITSGGSGDLPDATRNSGREMVTPPIGFLKAFGPSGPEGRHASEVFLAGGPDPTPGPSYAKSPGRQIDSQVRQLAPASLWIRR